MPIVIIDISSEYQAGAAFLRSQGVSVWREAAVGLWLSL